MDKATDSQKFGPAVLCWINYCQMYISVLLLSDITLPNGKCIDDAAYEGDRDALHLFEPGHGVNQTKPNQIIKHGRSGRDASIYHSIVSLSTRSRHLWVRGRFHRTGTPGNGN